MASEVLQVINRGNDPFKIRYGKVDYHLPPDGVPRAIPIEAVKYTCGDWEAVDSPHDAKRTEWRRTMNIRYGLLNAPWYSDEPIKTVGLTNDTIPEPVEDYLPAPEALVEGRYQYMHPNLPRLEVRDFDGNRIYTLLDDPDGDLVNGQAQARANDGSEAALKKAIAEKDRQIERLITAMSKVSPEAAAVLAAERNTPGVSLSPAADPLDAPDGPTAPLAPEDDPTSMDVMDEELGLRSESDDLTSPSASAPSSPRKKAAAKKASAPRPVEIGDEI